MAGIHRLVALIQPWDELEAAHQGATLRWLEGTDDVFRREKPATPEPHLVSYVVPVEPATASFFLVAHIRAQLWLPPGGHVESGEHPADAARREAHEELGLAMGHEGIGAIPAFVTVTPTVGADHHTDVSLWFLCDAGPGTEMTANGSEFSDARWWKRDEIELAPRRWFDPHFGRFLAKLEARTSGRSCEET